MTEFTADQAVMTSRVRDTFGPVVELEDESGNVSYYQVVEEFDVAGAAYAVLLPEDASKDEEPEIFKIVTSGDKLELVTIDDDEEWENVSELYDELTFPE
ncbi:DUF1292 domain-containing protein [Paenibacillus phoenicis]|uniref:DUF1292 domain-containing protein n=1 Tax=Paenibacillus phoenicis TaxID=554117 RepID=A0ABU5PKT6_9BACL|nr:MULTISPECIES: DUF1292 domain-containing protein [Paenibacillus]MCT2194447.1 DUF1292 domain-containing protein [Paenibacillus sp. p3-SID1389]MEA3570571.1 DUF1292 domain-containing protein [Paenibacillus phoenicis]